MNKLLLIGGLVVIIGGGMMAGEGLLNLLPRPTTLTVEQKQMLQERLHVDLLHLQLLYNLPQDQPPPWVVFDIQDNGTMAYTECRRGHIQGWHVRYNEKLAAQHWKRVFTDSIPHEVGHLIMCQLGDPDWDLHNARWESIVRELGYEPKQIFQLEVRE